MARYNIAQVNIGRIRAELDDPMMAGFVNRLAEINALADSSPGFVWRLIESEGNATYLRPFDDPRMLLNMSVWESVEQSAAVCISRRRTANCFGSGMRGSRN